MVGRSNLTASRPVCRHRGPRPLSPERKEALWLRDRAARATAIVLTRTVTRQPDGAWLVQSQRDDGRFYRVDLDSCSCADSWRHEWCKHRIAVAIVNHIRGGPNSHPDVS